MVDEVGKSHFYATAMWLKTGKIPQDIELVDVVVGYERMADSAHRRYLDTIPHQTHNERI